MLTDLFQSPTKYTFKHRLAKFGIFISSYCFIFSSVCVADCDCDNEAGSTGGDSVVLHRSSWLYSMHFWANGDRSSTVGFHLWLQLRAPFPVWNGVLSSVSYCICWIKFSTANL